MHCGAANNEHTQVCFACKQARSEFQEQLLHGRYQTVSVVGTGGFGMVYKALDVQAANRVVAVKQIHMRGLPPQKVIEVTDAFNREIQILTPLNNPHLPRIYDSFDQLVKLVTRGACSSGTFPVGTQALQGVLFQRN
jgi:hypothetical protein